MNKKEVKKSVYKSLKELGLTDLEASLYSVSLALGPATISELGKHLGISRPNVYKVIDGLEKRSLAKFIDPGNSKRVFSVEPPSVVLEKLRQKKEEISAMDHDLASSLPELLAVYHQGQSSTKIKVLKGEEQFLKIFNQSLEEAKGEMQFFGSAHDFIGFISWKEELRWIRKRIKKNIFLKALLLPSEDAQALKAKDSEELRETRILDDMTPFSSSFMLFANKLVFWQPKAPLALVLEDEYIGSMMKSIFDNFWAKSIKLLRKDIDWIKG